MYYQLSQTDYNGSTKFFTPIVLNCGEDFTKDKVLIYPNPVDKELNVILDVPIDKMEITDVYGRIIVSIVGNNQTIDVSNLQKGTYFLNLYYKDNKVVQKFIHK